MLGKIDLQNRTAAVPGTIKAHWFENAYIGLSRTLFHIIKIPLKPFDSGLEYEKQPVKTELVFDWYDLKLAHERRIGGLNLKSNNYPDAEASIYVGSAHNWCDVRKLSIQNLDDGWSWEVRGDVLVEFENERVAQNEAFKFNTTLTWET